MTLCPLDLKEKDVGLNKTGSLREDARGEPARIQSRAGGAEVSSGDSGSP